MKTSKYDNDHYAYKPVDNPIVLDFTDCNNWLKMYDILKDGFGFPEYFGNNPDALWDCLNCFCQYDLKIKIYGSKSISDDLKNEFALVLKVFDDVHKETPNITFEIIS